MSTAEMVAEMVDMLPDNEQLFALEFVKRLVLAWDPDYSKVTPAELAVHNAALEDYRRGETVSHDDINWD